MIAKTATDYIIGMATWLGMAGGAFLVLLFGRPVFTIVFALCGAAFWAWKAWRA